MRGSLTGDGQAIDAVLRAPRAALGLHLLGGFRATDRGADLSLPPSTWRLIAFLALAERPVDRGRVASSLWMDKSEERAHANLRSCLWRLRQVDVELVYCTPTHLQIGGLVDIDVREFVRLSRELVDQRVPLDVDEVDTGWFTAELLPDWYDDFVETEREQFRQLRLHALEALALRLSGAGRSDRALDVALTAVSAAPLRESAHRVVLAIHLDEGNVSEALRHYRTMCVLFERQLAVEPSDAARRLVERWLPDDARPPAQRGHAAGTPTS
jgi:DNA-binding SARP family transcriptional activator